MELKIERKNELTTCVKIVGRLDAATSPAFEKQTAACLEQGARGLILNFTDVDYISSAGLRVLIFIAKKMKTGSGAFALYGLRDHVKEVLEIAGFLSILQILPNEDEALAWVAQVIRD